MHKCTKPQYQSTHNKIIKKLTNNHHTNFTKNKNSFTTSTSHKFQLPNHSKTKKTTLQLQTILHITTPQTKYLTNKNQHIIPHTPTLQSLHKLQLSHTKSLKPEHKTNSKTEHIQTKSNPTNDQTTLQ